MTALHATPSLTLPLSGGGNGEYAFGRPYPEVQS